MIELPPRCLSVLNNQQVVSDPRDGVLAIEVGSEAVPVLEADLEDLLLLYVGHLDQVHQPLHREGKGRGRGRGRREGGKGEGVGVSGQQTRML